LKNPRWGVNNTCASRLADLIDLVTGPRLGHPITPGDLLSRLQSEGYVSKTNYYPAHKTKIR